MRNQLTKETSNGKTVELGQVVMTQGIADVAYRTDIRGHLGRHQAGDWGTICEDDKQINNDAVKHGDRILSAYTIDPALPAKGYGENVLWIITEADRSVTTILLPDEY